MSTISIADLQPIGFNLLNDSETYLKELTQGEINIQGGSTDFSLFPPQSLSTHSQGCLTFTIFTRELTRPITITPH